MEYTNRMLLKGNEAVVYGALLAGCECYFGYPITPASEIAHTAARCFPKLGRTFLQAECEIAAINMVMGAAANGRRAMTASSGLGISLKQEGISYLSGCELPALVVDITRGGPGLGNIAPEQADYNQVVKGGGHGSYRCIVLAPASTQEMCDLAFTAFDLAEKYRIVVYMLTDGVIGQTMETVTLPEPLPRREVPGWALDVSRPRTNMISSIYLETDDLEALNLRLQEKYRRIEAAEQRCELYQAEDADVLLVGYGISGRLARTAVDELRERGIRAGLLRPITLFPFPVDELRRLRAKQLIAVEMSCGQMIDDVKLAINCDRPVHLINRMGGNIPGTGEIVERTIKLISAEEK